MHFKARCWLLSLAIFCLFCPFYFGKWRHKNKNLQKWREKLKNQTFEGENLAKTRIPPADFLLENSKCRMETCFDFAKCAGKPFKVYVYPDSDHFKPRFNFQDFFCEKCPEEISVKIVQK